jgi:hypothetical protein
VVAADARRNNAVAVVGCIPFSYLDGKAMAMFPVHVAGIEIGECKNVTPDLSWQTKERKL